jgi:hypothetical protein
VQIEGICLQALLDFQQDLRSVFNGSAALNSSPVSRPSLGNTAMPTLAEHCLEKALVWIGRRIDARIPSKKVLASSSRTPVQTSPNSSPRAER